MHQAEERRLRRVFEQGFAAAGKLTREQARTLQEEGAGALNPYLDEPDRTRWREGFDRARSNGGKAPPAPKTFGRKR
jgi:hypothetical protein